MKFNLKKPCAECPFHLDNAKSYGPKRLAQFAETGCFPCHKTATLRRGSYHATVKSSVCAGMLIYNEKRGLDPVGMQLAERLLNWKRDELDLSAPVF